MSGDNIGMNVKNLKKENMPRVGDVMIYAKDATLKTSDNFSAQVQVLDIPGSIKAGYSPIGHVRCGRAACRLHSITWKQGKDTGGERPLEAPSSRPTTLLALSSSLNSLWSWTHSRTARVSP